MMLRSRRTVRMRLTALYCVLFVLSAVALLVIVAISNAGQGSGGPPSPRCRFTRPYPGTCAAR